MDKIQKILGALTPKEREAMLLLMEQIKRDYRLVPGLKSLKGMKGWFRVRLGHYRIIFFAEPSTRRIEIRRITRRNEGSYKRLS